MTLEDIFKACSYSIRPSDDFRALERHRLELNMAVEIPIAKNCGPIVLEDVKRQLQHMMLRKLYEQPAREFRETFETLLTHCTVGVHPDGWAAYEKLRALLNRLPPGYLEETE